MGDGLISISDTPEEYAEMVPHLRGMVADLGRDPGRFEAVMYLTVNVDPDPARANADATEFLTGTTAPIFGRPLGPLRRPGAG